MPTKAKIVCEFETDLPLEQGEACDMSFSVSNIVKRYKGKILSCKVLQGEMLERQEKGHKW